MGENIVNTPERIEENIGDALNARLAAMSSFLGLGPPDLCVTLKEYTPPKLLPGIIKPSKTSYFHWVLGADTSSEAAIAAYFGNLLDNQEKQPFGRGANKISMMIYCCYNAFKKMDLRVEISVPENSSKGYALDTYAVDANSLRHKVDESFWKETYICAMMRSIAGPSLYLRPLKIKDPLNETRAESYFFGLCADYFWEGRKLGSTDSVHSLAGVDCSNNLLTTTLGYYLMKYNRFEPAVSFFENFTNVDPVASIPIAYCEALMDKPLRAIDLLKSSLSKRPESASLMLALADLSLQHLPSGHEKHFQLLDALKLILKATARQPQFARGWWLMAKILLEIGRYEWALAVMNHAPVHDRGHDLNVDRIGISGYTKLTMPAITSPHITTTLQDEEREFMYEPGDESLRLLSATQLNTDEKHAYDLLAELVARNSWEQLTQMHSRILVRPAALQRARAKATLHLQDSMESIKLGDSYDMSMSTTDDKEDRSKMNSQTQRATEYASQPVITTEYATNTTSSVDPKEEDAPSGDRSEGTQDSGSPIQGASETAGSYDAGEREDSTEQQTQSVDGGLDHQTEKTDVTSSSVSTEESDRDPSADTESTDNSTNASSPSSSQQPLPLPDVTLEGETDIDDALTQFLAQYVSWKTAVPMENVQTTPMNIESASSPIIPVADISKAVDIAFHALFQDIKALQSWREEEKRKGLEKADILTPKFNPQRTPADWVRLGMLCERLKYTDDAEKIYKMCEALHPKALAAMVRLNAQRGDIRSTLMGATSMLNYYMNKYHIQQAHPDVITSVLRLISTHGLQKVRTIQSAIPNAHPLLSSIFLDAVRWRSKGFDA